MTNPAPPKLHQAEPQSDNATIAKSLASMLIEYVDGGIASNQNWRNGLDVIIERRLQRLAEPRREPTEGVVGALRRVTDCLETWAADHSDERTADVDAALYEARRALKAQAVTPVSGMGDDSARAVPCAAISGEMIAELRGLLAKATPRPWEAQSGGGRGAWIKGTNGWWTAMSCGDGQYPDKNADANAALLVAAVNVLPALLDEAERIAQVSATEGGRRAIPESIQPPGVQQEDQGSRGAYHGFDRETLLQIPAAILANVEEIENWSDSGKLITIHAHAKVLSEDLPALLAQSTEPPTPTAQGEGND